MHGQSEGRIRDGEDSSIILELLTTHIDNRFAELSKRLGIGQKLLGRGGGEGSDICPHEKPKKFDPPLTLGKKIVTLSKTIPKKYDPPL